MKIFIASDHAGVELKSALVNEMSKSQWLPSFKREVIDLGPQSTDSVDYPDFANAVCEKIHSLEALSLDGTYSFPKEMGILICGSGQGMAMRANKFSHIRAALCTDKELTRLSREHNDANVICLGARFTSTDAALKLLEIFFTTEFAGGRHSQRVQKICRM